MNLSILKILTNPNVLSNAFQTISVLFKALNTLTVKIHSLICRQSSPHQRIKFLPLLSDISASFFSLFRLVSNVILSDARIFKSFQLFNELSAKDFSEHHSSHPGHPLHYFSAFTIHTFLEPRIFSLLTSSFYTITSYFDQGKRTSNKILKILLDCKFTLKQFYSFYLLN